MNKKYILLELAVIGGKISLINSWLKQLNNNDLNSIIKHVDQKIENQLSTDLDIREKNTYKEATDNRSSIDFLYVRTVENDDGDSFTMGVVDNCD